MKNIVKTFGFIGVMCVISAVVAAENSRIGVVSKSASRVPVTRRTTTTARTSIADVLPKQDSYYSNAECIEKYTDCIRADDVCGSDMEECTTRVLFHAQMPKCISTLSLCLDRDIVELFGASKNNLSAGAKYEDPKNPESAILDFTYPSDSSIVGQMILGAKVANQLDDSQCMKKYTSCIKKDNVCGEDFELCTENKHFQKQAVACNSILARCKSTGKKELFGKDVEVTGSGSNLTPANSSVLGQYITDGRELAAANAVSTCYKIADQCIVGVCKKSPFACIAGTTLEVAASGETANTQKDSAVSFKRTLSKDAKNALEMSLDSTYGAAGIAAGNGMLLSARDVRAFINSHCGDTIGSSEYCYMTSQGKKPSKKQLSDPEVRDEVFEDIYNARMGSDTKAGFVKPRLQQIADDFDAEAKGKCVETISACVMRSCGGGIGSVCYKRVLGAGVTEKSINNSNQYEKIQRACAAVVNTDANCQYAKAKASSSSYAYNFVDGDVFTTLFPKYKANENNDPIGVVASLNASLATSYNDAAIAQMKKQCENTVTSCVKSMCGKDYVKCYRNRTDITAASATMGEDGANNGGSYGTYATGQSKLDKSMNRVGGILDYNIVIGLCMSTVKNASTCEEHLKIASADWLEREEALDQSSWRRSGWGQDYASVRNAWVDANTTSATVVNKQTDYTIVVGYEPKDSMGGVCDGRSVGVDNSGFIDEEGCVYDKPIYQEYEEYALENVGTTLFQSVLKDVEREVQAKYNAKLTQEQNVCLANNEGGIRGAGQNGSSFMWVKMTKKIPNNYAIKGLSTKDFTSSNDLYGSFCRVRVMIQSDDKNVQEVLANDKSSETTAYFAVGDTFTCGSWLSEDTLNKITKKIGDNAAKDAGKGGAKDKIAYAWSTVGGFLAGGLGGYFGMDALQKNDNSLGGLLGGGLRSEDQAENLTSECSSNLSTAQQLLDEAKRLKKDCDNYKTTNTDANGIVLNIISGAEEIKAEKCQNAEDKLSEANNYLNRAFRNMQNAGTNPVASNYRISGFDKEISDDLCDGIAISDKDKNKRRNANLIAGAALSAVGAGLGAGITGSVLEAKYQGISDEAVKAWLQEVGEHIKCYVGTEELGSYGDIVNFNID